MNQDELKSTLNRLIDSDIRSVKNPDRGRRNGLVSYFEIHNLSGVLRQLAEIVEAEEKKTEYSPVSISIDRVWNAQTGTHRVEIVMEDMRWYIK